MDQGRSDDSSGPDGRGGQCDGGGEPGQRALVPAAGERGGDEHQPDGERRGAAVGAAGAQRQYPDGIPVGGWDQVASDQQRHGAAAGACVCGVGGDEPHGLDGGDRIIQQRQGDGRHSALDAVADSRGATSSDVLERLSCRHFSFDEGFIGPRVIPTAVPAAVVHADVAEKAVHEFHGGRPIEIEYDVGVPVDRCVLQKDLVRVTDEVASTQRVNDRLDEIRRPSGHRLVLVGEINFSLDRAAAWGRIVRRKHVRQIDAREDDVLIVEIRYSSLRDVLTVDAEADEHRCGECQLAAASNTSLGPVYHRNEPGSGMDGSPCRRFPPSRSRTTELSPWGRAR